MGGREAGRGRGGAEGRLPVRGRWQERGELLGEEAVAAHVCTHMHTRAHTHIHTTHARTRTHTRAHALGGRLSSMRSRTQSTKEKARPPPRETGRAGEEGAAGQPCVLGVGVLHHSEGSVPPRTQPSPPACLSADPSCRLKRIYEMCKRAGKLTSGSHWYPGYCVRGSLK